MEEVELKWLTPSWDEEAGPAPPVALLVAAALFAASVMPCALRCAFGPPLERVVGLVTSRGKRGAALVIAHPDDEAMFFWPTLVRLRGKGVPLSILCLSTGNADGLGETRSEEMRKSAERLGVAGDALRILDVAELQDGFHAWDQDVVARHVLEFLKERKAAWVFTFDDKGVSGHPNHISASQGVCKALAEVCKTGGGSGAAPFDVYMLQSVGVFGKYLGPLSLLWTDLAASGSAGCTSSSAYACLQALAVHWSQLVWYRILFAVFSRYAYVNTYTRASSPVESEPVECAAEPKKPLREEGLRNRR